MGGLSLPPLSPRALSHPHLNVSHKSSVKWGWLAEGTAKFEKPHPEAQLNSWPVGTPVAPWRPQGTSHWSPTTDTLF